MPILEAKWTRTIAIAGIALAALAVAAIVMSARREQDRAFDVKPTVSERGCDTGEVEGSILALDGKTGRLLWSARTGQVQHLAMVDGVVLADPTGPRLSSEHQIVARDGRTGAVRWCGEGQRPLVVDHHLLVASRGTVSELDPADGTLLPKASVTPAQLVERVKPTWTLDHTYETPDITTFDPDVDVPSIRQITTVRRTDGSDEPWTVPGNLIFGDPAVFGDVLIGLESRTFDGPPQRTIYGFDLLDRTETWMTTAGRETWSTQGTGDPSVVVLNQAVRRRGYEGNVSLGLIETTTGRIRWEVDVEDPARSRQRPEVGGVNAATIGPDGTIYVATSVSEPHRD